MSVTVNLPRVPVGQVRVSLPRATPNIVTVTKEVVAGELDDTGQPVPVWLAHTFAYDGSGNLSTDTVSQGDVTWVRTYGWANGAQTSDSGWVRNG